MAARGNFLRGRSSLWNSVKFEPKSERFGEANSEQALSLLARCCCEAGEMSSHEFYPHGQYGLRHLWKQWEPKSPARQTG